VQQVKDRLRLFVVPPYSPEINPDDRIIQDVTGNGG
jgi:hypothetical protein